MKLFTKVLPDDSPKLLKYRSGWSNDKSFSKGIDFTMGKGNIYIDSPTSALDTMKSCTF